MDNQTTSLFIKKLREQLRNPISWIISFVILSLIIIIIAIIVNLTNSTNLTPQIHITNLSTSDPNYPLAKQDTLESMLYMRVFKTLGYETVEEAEQANIITQSGATIREGSVESSYDSIMQVYSGSFLVDIDSVQQSYWVRYYWPEYPENFRPGDYDAITFFCPTATENIYENFSCNSLENSAYGTSTPQEQFLDNTPVYLESAEGDTVLVQAQRYGGDGTGAVYAEVDVDSCGNQRKIDSAKEATVTWFTFIGISEEDIDIRVLDLCPGGF